MEKQFELGTGEMHGRPVACHYIIASWEIMKSDIKKHTDGFFLCYALFWGVGGIFIFPP